MQRQDSVPADNRQKPNRNLLSMSVRTKVKRSTAELGTITHQELLILLSLLKLLMETSCNISELAVSLLLFLSSFSCALGKNYYYTLIKRNMNFYFISLMEMIKK